jgi:hypothetical protein
MARRQSEGPCATCGRTFPSAKLSRVIIEAHTILLCKEHATIVARAMPKTFEHLRRLFLEPETGATPARRSLIERRGVDDRRVFPPRPEGRRMGGRRKEDAAA